MTFLGTELFACGTVEGSRNGTITLDILGAIVGIRNQFSVRGIIARTLLSWRPCDSCGRGFRCASGSVIPATGIVWHIGTTDTADRIVVLATIADVHHVDIIIHTADEPLTILGVGECVATAVCAHCRFKRRSWRCVTGRGADILVAITVLPADTLLFFGTEE